MDQAMVKIAALSSVNDKIHRIRVETLDAN
jgi:hypothetical protein